ncbi:MAG: hypothetical protein KDB37_01600 [Ilumatobacter sp.]|nr:hypothetical protein [Ilumatobacter sp.]
MHPLFRALLDATEGRFPPVDGGVTHVEPPGRVQGVVAFTGHTYVMAPAPILPTDDDGVPAPDGYGGSHDPRYVAWLARDAAEIGVLDAVLFARGTGAGSAGLEPTDRHDQHHRVEHARAIRDDVRVFGDERGFVTLSTGLVGRTEFGVEADPAGHNRGWGRSLVADALGLIPDGEPVFAAVSPGNARSMRAFLALGFVPIGSEQLWVV